MLISKININKYGVGLLSLAVWLVSLGFYIYTLAPTVVWGDPAKLVNLAYLNKLRIHTANHALHNLIGHFWGKLAFADYAYGQNLLSAVFASLTVLLIFAITYQLTRSVLASMASAVALALAHTFWWLAVITESYSLAFFLLALAIFSIVKWLDGHKVIWLYLCALVLGLGISNHYMLAVLTPAFILAVLVDRPEVLLDWKKVCGTAASFVFGAGLLVYIYFTQFPSLAWGNMVESCDIESLGKMLREMVKYPLYLFYQFPVFGFLLGVVGLWQKHKAAVLLAVLFLINYFFSALYMWERQPEMMVFGYLVFAVWIGLGFKALQETLSSEQLVSLIVLLGLLTTPILLYNLAPAAAQRLGGNVLGIRSLPYRDNDQYFLKPNKRGYVGARRFAQEVFAALPAKAMLIADFTPYTVLKYWQLVAKNRPDIDLVYTGPPVYLISRELIENNLAKRAVYLADIDDYPEDYLVPELSKHYMFIKDGLVYRLEKRK